MSASTRSRSASATDRRTGATFRRRLLAGHLAGEQAAGEREVRDEAETEALAAGSTSASTSRSARSTRSARRRTARPKRGRARPSSRGFRGVVGRPVGADLALVDQLLDGPRSPRAACRDLPRGAGRGRSARPADDRVTRRWRADVVAAAAALGAVAHRLPELRRQHDAVATTFQDPAEQRLAITRAVDVGGVEERHARVESRIHHRARARLVDSAAEVVAAEPDDADRQIARPEAPRTHSSRL